MAYSATVHDCSDSNYSLFLMKIEVHVKESVITINCGDGGQSIRWLAEAALIKYDPNYMMTTG